MATVAETIREAVERSGKSLSAIGNGAGITGEFLGMIIAGKRVLSLDKTPALARATGLDPAELTWATLREQAPAAYTALSSNPECSGRIGDPDPLSIRLAVLEAPVRKAIEALVEALASRRSRR